MFEGLVLDLGFSGLHLGQTGKDNPTQLFSQAAEGAVLGFQDLLFIGFESGFGVIESFDHDPPKQHRQLPRQGHVGDQAPAPTTHPSVESAQGYVFGSGKAACHHTE